MMSSQLGRIILLASDSSEDEMQAAPDSNGGYGPIDGLLDEVAAGVRADSDIGSDRRPGSLSSVD